MSVYAAVIPAAESIPRPADTKDKIRLLVSQEIERKGPICQIGFVDITSTHFGAEFRQWKRKYTDSDPAIVDFERILLEVAQELHTKGFRCITLYRERKMSPIGTVVGFYYSLGFLWDAESRMKNQDEEPITEIEWL
jgi:hypothetical protein